MIKFNEYKTRKEMFDAGFGCKERGIDTIKEFNRHLYESENNHLNEGPNGGFGIDPVADKSFTDFGAGMCGFLFFGPPVLVLGAVAGAVGVGFLISKISRNRHDKKMRKEIDTAANNYKKAYYDSVINRMRANALKNKLSSNDNESVNAESLIEKLSNEETEKFKNELNKLKTKQEALDKKYKAIDSDITQRITSTAKDGGNGDPELLSYKRQKFTEAEIAALEDASKDAETDDDKKSLDDAINTKNDQKKDEEKNNDKTKDDTILAGYQFEVNEDEYENLKNECGDAFEKLYNDKGIEQIEDAARNKIEKTDGSGKKLYLLEYKYDSNLDGVNKYVKENNFGEENQYTLVERDNADTFKNNNNYEFHPWYNHAIIYKIKDEAKQTEYDSAIKGLSDQINSVVKEIKDAAKDGKAPDAKKVASYAMVIESLYGFMLSNPDKDKAKENAEKIKTARLFSDEGKDTNHINENNVTAVLVSCSIKMTKTEKEKSKYISDLKAACKEAINSSAKNANDIAKALSNQVDSVIDACEKIKIKDSTETLNQLEIELNDEGIVKGTFDTNVESEDTKKLNSAIKTFRTDLSTLLQNKEQITNDKFTKILDKVFIACKQIIDNPDKYKHQYNKLKDFYNNLIVNNNGEIKKNEMSFDDYVERIKNLNVSNESKIYYTYKEYLDEKRNTPNFKKEEDSNIISSDIIDELLKKVDSFLKSLKKKCAKDKDEKEKFYDNVDAANDIKIKFNKKKE